MVTKLSPENGTIRQSSIQQIDSKHVDSGISVSKFGYQVSNLVHTSPISHVSQGGAIASTSPAFHKDAGFEATISYFNNQSGEG